jgi:CheY-like chemotaxis protein
MAPTYQRSQLKILLVEDNLTNQTVLLKQLHKLGYTANAASHGQEAICAVSMEPYDILLMDCQMPVLNGYDATRQIRQLEETLLRDRPPLIIIALTANAIHQDYDKAIAAGMNDYLGKPVSKDILEKTLDHWGEAIANQNLPIPVVAPVTQLTSVSVEASYCHLDRLHLSLMADGNPDFERELLHMFVRNSQDQIKQLQQAIATDNLQQVEHIAHYLKGASANVGAKLIHTASAQLEDDAHYHSLQNCDRLLADMVRSLQELQKLLYHSSTSE